MKKLIEQHLVSLDSKTIDQFRSLFYQASDTQLESISARYEGASGLHKEWIYDDGARANMIRWLGEELILISLYHSFEKKLKEIVRFKRSFRGMQESDNERTLHCWEEIKKHIPRIVKDSSDFQQINTLRKLVNCFKHAGVVSKELHKSAPSFGEIGGEISCDLVIYTNRTKHAHQV